LEGVAAVGEPLLTGGVGCRGVLGTDLPLSPCDRGHRRAWEALEEDGRDRKRPWAAVFSLRREGHQGIPQRLGLLRHRRDLAVVVLRFVGVEALLDVRAAVLQQALDQTSEFVRRGCDGLGGPESRFHPSKESP
jgi:hypothetical protein